MGTREGKIGSELGLLDLHILVGQLCDLLLSFLSVLFSSNCSRRESNPQPSDLRRDALTIELT